MAELQIARAWDEGDSRFVVAYEVVEVRGNRETIQYEVCVEKGGKTARQIQDAITAALKAQRSEKRPAEHANVLEQVGEEALDEQGNPIGRKVQV